MESQSRGSAESGISRAKHGTQRCDATDYKEYRSLLKDFSESKNVYIFFTGTESSRSGYSWCPACMEVLQVLEKYLPALQDSIFLTVHVGTQEEWEDKTNLFRQPVHFLTNTIKKNYKKYIFRTDKQLNLKVIPTVLKYKSPKRLEGLYCLKSELLDLLFEDECEF